LLVGPPALASAAALVTVLLPPARVTLVGGLAVLAVAYETMGSQRPRGGVVAHLWSGLASGVVAVGWLGGAFRELAASDRA
jgi:hypothetical protein